ncbi:MAG: ribosome recycling factor [Candidatus Omnitrophica bacterium]|nr:ribosome recycling factor [Candidatus Omnitrophota bacterium]
MAERPEIRSILDETHRKMEKAFSLTRKEFQDLRTGRASSSLVEGLQVDYYGTPTPLKGLATISIPDPRTLQLQPWDVSVIGEIEKAVLKSELGLTPMNDGKVVRIPIPPLSEERRLELAKLVRKTAEEGRVAIRNIRHEAIESIKSLEKSKKISEDESHHGQKEVQKLTDRFIVEVDQTVTKKEQEIKTI